MDGRLTRRTSDKTSSSDALGRFYFQPRTAGDKGWKSTEGGVSGSFGFRSVTGCSRKRVTGGVVKIWE